MRPLKVRDVERALGAAGGRVGAFHIGKEAAGKPGYDNTSCLLRRTDGSWLVAYFERGSYQDPRVFDTEEEGCADVLALVGLVPVQE